MQVMTTDRAQELTEQVAKLEAQIKKAEKKFYALRGALDSLYGQLEQASYELKWRKQGLTEPPKLPSFHDSCMAALKAVHPSDDAFVISPDDLPPWGSGT